MPAAAAADFCCRASRSACGITSAASTTTRYTVARHSRPLTTASHTSIWPTTTAPSTARPRRTSAASCVTASAATATRSSSRQRPVMTCGPAPTATGAAANICSPHSTRACDAWASNMSIYSIHTGPIPKLRSRRPWRRSRMPYAAARHCMPVSRTTMTNARAAPPRFCAATARPA